MIKVIRYNAEYQDRWDNFVKTSKNGTFLLQRRFMEYHKDRFEDYSVLLVNEKSEIIGVFPASISDETTVVSHGGLTYGSLILSPTAKLPLVIDCFHDLLQFYHNQGIERIYYKTVPSFYHTMATFEEQYIMFLLNAKNYRTDTSFVVNLQQPYTFQKRRIRSIKKGIKNGVTIEIATNFDTYWQNILTPNLMNRFGVKPVHSLDEISRLEKKFPNNIAQYNALIDGKIVAGTTLFIAKNTVHAQYISGSDIGRKSGALDYLFAHLIQDAYKDFTYFSFGISNEEQGTKINKGLCDWKESYGAKVFLNHFYELEVSNYSRLKNRYL